MSGNHRNAIRSPDVPERFVKDVSVSLVPPLVSNPPAAKTTSFPETYCPGERLLENVLSPPAAMRRSNDPLLCGAAASACIAAPPGPVSWPASRLTENAAYEDDIATTDSSITSFFIFEPFYPFLFVNLLLAQIAPRAASAAAQ